MKPLRRRIEEECILKNAQFDIIEKDYALSYVLAGIVKQPELSHSLVFKGGTALKKIFFGDYRFSVDLDFSTVEAPKGHSLETALEAATNTSLELLSNYGPFDIQIKRRLEKNLHPTGQEAFNINVKFPWHRTALCTIKIEVTHDEPVIIPPVYKSIIHGYQEALDCTIACYHIEEIVAEKLRALLQTHKKLVTRGWNKFRARDYYDLWCVLKNYSSGINKTRLIELLNVKCKHRDVSYSTINDFFTSELVNNAHQHWQSTLGFLVKELPQFELVSNEAKALVFNILN